MIYLILILLVFGYGGILVIGFLTLRLFLIIMLVIVVFGVSYESYNYIKMVNNRPNYEIEGYINKSDWTKTKGNHDIEYSGEYKIDNGFLNINLGNNYYWGSDLPDSKKFKDILDLYFEIEGKKESLDIFFDRTIEGNKCLVLILNKTKYYWLDPITLNEIDYFN